MNEELHNSSIEPELEARIVALVLGEASDFERDELTRLIEARPELAVFKLQMQKVNGLLQDAGTGEVEAPGNDWKLPTDRRNAVLAVIRGVVTDQPAGTDPVPAEELNSVPSARSEETMSDEPGSRPAAASLMKSVHRFRRNLTQFAAVVCVAAFIGIMTFRSFGPEDRASSNDLYKVARTDTPRDDFARSELLGRTTLSLERSTVSSLTDAKDFEKSAAFTVDPPGNSDVLLSAIQDTLNASSNLRGDSSQINESLGRSNAPILTQPELPSAEPATSMPEADTPSLLAKSDAAWMDRDAETGDGNGNGVTFSMPREWSIDDGVVSLGEKVSDQPFASEGEPAQSDGLKSDVLAGRKALPGETDPLAVTESVSDGREAVELKTGGEKQNEEQRARGMSLAFPMGDVTSSASGPKPMRTEEELRQSDGEEKSDEWYAGHRLMPMDDFGAVVSDDASVKSEPAAAGLPGGSGGSGQSDNRKYQPGGGEPGNNRPVDESRPEMPASPKSNAEGDRDSIASVDYFALEESLIAGKTLRRGREQWNAAGDSLEVLESEKEVKELQDRISTDNLSDGESSGSDKSSGKESPAERESVAGRRLERGSEPVTETSNNPPVQRFSGINGRDAAKSWELLPSVRGDQQSESWRKSDERLAKNPELSLRYRAPAQKDEDSKEAKKVAAPLIVAPAGLNEKTAAEEAFSTFSLHVSDVSFKLAFAALARGEWPEAAKIRIEEFVNRFDYGDPLPSKGEKIACRVEQSIHPFLQQRNLLRISMRTAASGRASNTPLRLTFLLDNSGSMERTDRQQTVRRAFALLAQQLTPIDQVTLISFARQPRLLADKVSGAEAEKLVRLINELPSEGGTNIEAALQLAFEKAREQQASDGQNRIVLLTDGAVNLGNADPESLSRMVTSMRTTGIAFDAAGISADGLNDEVLEALTRKGDGRYYLLDSAEAADDGFVRQIAGALRPSAKNVKVQVEFNPKRVGHYKLLGFEKHTLNKEDFRNDKVDAAEMTAAEAGVAIYQFEPKADGEGDAGSVSVRFQDLSTGEMIENRWPIPYEPDAPRLEQAAPSLRIATSAALLAAKLRGEPLGETVDLKTLSRLISELPEQHRSDTRVRELQQMIEQTRQLK